MLTYTIIMAAFCLEIFLMSHDRTLRGKSRLCAVVIFVQFLILLGFRDPSVLCDTDGYYYHYNKLLGRMTFDVYDPHGRFDRGYQMVEHLFRNNLGLSFMWFEAFVAGSFLAGTIYFLYRYSRYTWMALFLMVMTLYMLNSVIAMRQSMAIGVGLAGFPLLQCRRYFAYGLVALLASSFHSSAVGFFLLIPLMWDGLSYKKKAWLIIGGGLAAFLGYSIVFASLTEHQFYGGHYVNTSMDKGGVTMVGVYAFIRTSGLIAYILYLRHLKKGIYVYNEHRLEETMFLVCLLDLAISAFAIRFWIMGRFKLYFDPFIFAYIAALYPALRHSRRVRYATWLLLIFVIATSLFLLYYRPEWIRLLPYKLYDR